MSDYPEDLKYSSEQEWVRSGNGNSVRVGITEYAAEQLGDIVFVTLPEVGEAVAAGDACGELESTKSRESSPRSTPCWISTRKPSTTIRTVMAGSSRLSSTSRRIWTTCWTLILMLSRSPAETISIAPLAALAPPRIAP